jgi:hypothetical protein
MSKTKLVVIDTKTCVARSYHGNHPCGVANLPDPEDGEFSAVQIIRELNDFRMAADAEKYPK